MSHGLFRHRFLAIMSVTGEVMITLGVLLASFVVWEVWWTDLSGVRHQREIVENLDWIVPAVPNTGEPSDDGQIDVITPDERGDEGSIPAEVPSDVTTTFATMYVPRWGEDYVRPISEGVGRRQVLDPKGIGHYPDTAMPGGWGNFAIAGHRTTYGKPFDRIDELVVGDTIVIRTESAWYVYRVTSTHIVDPSFVAAIAPVPGDSQSPPNGRYITLTSCHPRFSASHRYVVFGILDYWASASGGYPPEVVSTIADKNDDGLGGVGEVKD